MAIGHVAVRAQSRAKGHTAAAGLSYRCGVPLLCPRTDVLHSYSGRGVDVAATGIESGVPTPLKGSLDALVAGVEAAELRRDSKIARDVQIALPRELNLQDQIDVTKVFVERLTARYETVAAWAVHVPTADSDGDRRNSHAHVWMATRSLDKTTGALAGKLLQLDEIPRSRTEIREIRLLWERTVNEMLAKRGKEARVDVGRRADGDPAPTLGAAKTALERKARRRRASKNPDKYRQPESVTHGLSAAKLVRDGGAVTGAGHRLAQHGSRRRRRRRVRIERAVSAEPHTELVLEELVTTAEPEAVVSPLPRIERARALVAIAPEPAPIPSPLPRIERARALVAIAPEPGPIPSPLPRIERARALVAIAPEPAPIPSPLPRIERARALVAIAPEPAPIPSPLPRIERARALVAIAPEPAPFVSALPTITPERDLRSIAPEPAPRPIGPLTFLLTHLRRIHDLITIVMPARKQHADLRQSIREQRVVPPTLHEFETVKAYWNADHTGTGNFAESVRQIAQTRFGHGWETGKWNPDPTARREEIADRLHSGQPGPRATVGRTAAEQAAVVLDRYLLETSRISFGQCAPPNRPFDPQPGEPDDELRAWHAATQAAAETWKETAGKIIDQVIKVITQADVVTLRERRREAAAAHRGVRPKGKERD